MSPKFEADSTFNVVGRGLALAGWIAEGKIRPGMSLSIPTFPKKLALKIPHFGGILMSKESFLKSMIRNREAIRAMRIAKSRNVCQ